MCLTEEVDRILILLDGPHYESQTMMCRVLNSTVGLFHVDVLEEIAQLLRKTVCASTLIPVAS